MDAVPLTGPAEPSALAPLPAPAASLSASERLRSRLWLALAAVQRAWLASSQVEQWLAIGAVTLLVLTVALIFGFSGRE